MFVYYKCYILIELTFLKEFMLIKKANQKCDICHFWYFLNKSFKFQPNVCNVCHDLSMTSIDLCDIVILNIKISVYCCIISKIEAINLMQNIDLTKKVEHYKKLKFIIKYKNG